MRPRWIRIGSAWAAAALALTLQGAHSASAATAASDTVVTTVIVVRHAEKNMAWAGADPPLSEAGKLRAGALAHALSTAGVRAIYVTHFLRTRATAESLAAITGDSIEVVDQDHTDALAERVWNRDRGRTVLIVGHSDTVPAIVRSLGGPPVEIVGGEFDAMFVLTRRGSEAPHLVRLRYGAR